MLQKGNIFENLPPCGSDEAFEDLLRGQGLRVERIVSHGHASSQDFWYQQVEAEWVMVLRGAARVEFEGGTVHRMGPGDYVLIPPQVRHRVDWTDPDTPTVWLAIHFPSQG